jgi:hypothetical protein
MRKIIFIIVFCHFYNYLGAQNIVEPCKYWFVEPILYNNTIENSNIVTSWANYQFRTKEVDSTNFIPDTLKIKLSFIPSLTLSDYDKLPDTVYTFVSLFYYKYGDKADSYVLFNPRVSDSIVLFNKKLNLNEGFENYWASNNDKFERIFPIQSIPFKSMLIEQGIYLNVSPWNYQKGMPLYLNQIVICNYFINSRGEIICSSEFTFPINGAYNHTYRGVIEY